MKRPRPHALLLCFFAAAAAGASSLQDFQAGLELRPDAARPVAELQLPEAVYRDVTRADLYDVGVFNAAGTPVPFAFCPPLIREAAAPVLKQQALTVFTLRGPGARHADGSRVEVSGADGLTVTVQPGAGANAAQEADGVSAYVVDTGPIGYPLVALYLGWRSGAAELHLRIDQSDDLDRWDTLIPATTLVRIDASGQTLARNRVPLPSGHRRYLRLSSSDPGPPPVIEPVQAEFSVQDSSTRPPAPAQAAPLPWPPGETGFLFDAQQLAPMQSAHISLPAMNMSLQLALQSRADAGSAWRTVWSGPVFEVGDGAAARRSPDPQFSPDSDRWWRIQVQQGAESLGQAQPGLLLYYYPAVLRFLTQGEGPFVLAYGSRRVTQPSAVACGSLLQGLPQQELQTLISRDFNPGAVRTLGGAAALQPAPPPPPKPTSQRQALLWAVLLLGAAAVAWMALSLLGRLRDGQA
jgi:hypothetical protein